MASSNAVTSTAATTVLSKQAEQLRSKCHTLLLTERYNPAAMAQPLEEALNSQCAEQWYDAELNSALLKLYQMYPSEQEKVVKTDCLVKILLKAIMQLPESDFSLAMMMVPEQLQNSELIKSIALMAEKLQMASFPEFWDLVKVNNDIIQKVPGFANACRRYILRVVGMTFREISQATLAKYLGLGSARDLGGALAPEGQAFLNENEGIVVLPPNPDNHPKSTRMAAAQDIRLEQVADLISSLEVGKQLSKKQGQVISVTGREGIAKMKKELAQLQVSSSSS